MQILKFAFVDNFEASTCFYHYGIGEYSTVHLVSHCSLNFECPHLGYGHLSIILVLEKCNFGP